MKGGRAYVRLAAARSAERHPPVWETKRLGHPIAINELVRALRLDL